MSDEKAGDITIFTKRQVNNPLLCRKQMNIEIIHTSKVNCSKIQIKEKLAKMFKTDSQCIAVFGLKFKFGGGRSAGFAFVYESLDARKKNDQKMLLRRDKLYEKVKKHGRKALKEIKGRQNKLRGVAKARAISGGSKKK